MKNNLLNILTNVFLDENVTFCYKETLIYYVDVFIQHCEGLMKMIM